MTRARGRGLTRIEAMMAGKTSFLEEHTAAATAAAADPLVESASLAPADADLPPAGNRSATAVKRLQRLQTSVTNATSDEGQPTAVKGLQRIQASMTSNATSDEGQAPIGTAAPLAGTAAPPVRRTPHRKRLLKDVLQGSTGVLQGSAEVLQGSTNGKHKKAKRQQQATHLREHGDLPRGAAILPQEAPLQVTSRHSSCVFRVSD